MANPKEQETNALNRNDLAVILEVNKKAIELQTSNVSLNEEILENLEQINANMDTIKSNIDQLERSLYKLQIMLVAGALPIIYEIIKMLTK